MVPEADPEATGRASRAYKGCHQRCCRRGPVVFKLAARDWLWTISLHHTAARSNAFCGKDEPAAKSKQVVVKF